MDELLNTRSERLLISRLTPADSGQLFSYYSDAEAMKFRANPPMKSLEEADEMVASALKQYQGRLYHRMAVRLNSAESTSSANSKTLLGTLLMIVPAKEQDELEIGFSFGKKHWGKGYASELLRLVILELQSAYNKVNQQEPDNKQRVLRAWVHQDNVASVHLFRSADFELLEQDQFPDRYLFRKNIFPVI